MAAVLHPPPKALLINKHHHEFGNDNNNNKGADQCPRSRPSQASSPRSSLDRKRHALLKKHSSTRPRKLQRVDGDSFFKRNGSLDRAPVLSGSNSESESEQTVCIRRFNKRQHHHRKNSEAGPCDLAARARCFTYLESAIDEAWAMYYDGTSIAENEIYNEASLSGEGSSDETEEHVLPTSASQVPRNLQLQKIKERLSKAKADLEDLTEDKTRRASAWFWQRWDTIKYAAVELCESEDDDDDIEKCINELEDGRFPGE